MLSISKFYLSSLKGGVWLSAKIPFMIRTFFFLKRLPSILNFLTISRLNVFWGQFEPHCSYIVGSYVKNCINFLPQLDFRLEYGYGRRP